MLTRLIFKFLSLRLVDLPARKRRLFVRLIFQAADGFMPVLFT